MVNDRYQHRGLELKMTLGGSAWACVASLFFGLSLQADTISWPLLEAEQMALRRSGAMAALEKSAEAARWRARSLSSRRGPSLSLEGFYRHQSEVPLLRPSPLSPPVELGDNANYSLGPSLQWLVWDSGQRSSSVRSALSLAAAQDADRAALDRRIRLQVRLAYFQVLGAAEQVKRNADALRLAQAQQRDIEHRFSAGTSDRMETLKARSETVLHRQDLRVAQTEFSGALRRLFALTQRDDVPNLSRPWPAGSTLPAEVPSPTSVVSLDPFSDLDTRFQSTVDRPFYTAPPENRALQERAQSARDAARGQRASGGPTLWLSGRVSRDYPNGPIHEAFQQETVGVTGRWPIFEWNRAAREAREQEALALAWDDQNRQTLQDRQNEWEETRERLSGLRDQETLQAEAVALREELARLTYAAYQAGRAPFLEVQNANTALVAAHTQRARTHVDILSQWARLDFLSSPE